MEEPDALNPLEAYLVVKAVSNCSYETREEVKEELEKIRS